MNIIAMRQEKRKNQIGWIKESIKKALEVGQEIDHKRLLLVVMSDLGVSKRTAREYIEIALFQLEDKSNK